MCSGRGQRRWRLSRVAVAWVLFVCLFAVPAWADETPGELTHRYYVPLSWDDWWKRGVGLTYGQCEDVARTNSRWQFGWTLTPTQCERSLAVPMVWCDEALTDVAQGMPILALNEPDRPWPQCNMTPEGAARRWRELEERYPDNPLIGPAVSDKGEWWLHAWREAYIKLYGEPPRITALNVHCYQAQPCTCMDWIGKHISLAREWTSSGKVWVTEFAYLPCWYPVEQAVANGKTLVEWMEREPGVEAYAWFAARYTGLESWAWGPECVTALFTMDGEPTPFGQWYGR